MFSLFSLFSVYCCYCSFFIVPLLWFVNTFAKAVKIIFKWNDGNVISFVFSICIEIIFLFALLLASLTILATVAREFLYCFRIFNVLTLCNCFWFVFFLNSDNLAIATFARWYDVWVVAIRWFRRKLLSLSSILALWLTFFGTHFVQCVVVNKGFLFLRSFLTFL